MGWDAEDRNVVMPNLLRTQLVPSTCNMTPRDKLGPAVLTLLTDPAAREAQAKACRP